MPTRDLIVAIKSKWDGVALDKADKGFQQTEKSAKKLSDELGRVERQARQQSAALTQSTTQAGRFERQLEDVGRTAIRTRRLLEETTKRLPEIEVTADTTEPQRKLAGIAQQLRDLSGKRLDVDIDASKAADEAARIRRELVELASMHPEVVVGANIERAVRDLDRVEREARDLDRRINIKVDVDGGAAAAALGVIQGALAAVRSTGVGTGVAVAAAIGALPGAAALAESAVAVGLGGALAGIGLAASHGSDAAQDAIGDLKEYAKREAALMGAPFESVWTFIVQVAERELHKLSPVVRNALGDLAPDVKDFVDDAGASLEELEPAIGGIERAFSAVLQQLGPRMPEIMQHLAAAINEITSAVEEDPQLLADFAVNLAKVAEWAANATTSLAKFVRWSQENAAAIKSLIAVVNPAAGAVSLFAGESDKAGRQSLNLGKSVQKTTDDLRAIGTTSDEASTKMREGWASAYSEFAKLGEVASSARQRASAQESLAQAQARAAEVQRQGAERIARAERELADTQEQSAERIKAAKARVAEAHRQAAEAVQAAQQRVRDAQDAVTEAIEEGAQREAAAEQRVEQAREQAARAAVEAGRRVEDAARRLADAQADAAARQVDAERRVQDAHRRTEEAVEDLTAARQRAQERLEDLIAAESGSALDEEGAALAIERARQRMDEVNADPEATDLDRREADLAYRQALQRLEEVKRRNQELRDDLADAQRRGIDGSTEVVDALGRIEEARRAEAEAEEAAARQREESARQVADAEQALADARSDAARQQEDAARALAEAEAELDRTRVDNAKAVREAQEDVAKAQADAAQAAKDSARQVSEAQAEAAKAVRDASRDVIDAEKAVRDTRQEVARDTRSANDSVLESWARLRGDAQLTSQQLLAELEKQVKDQEQWASNLISLAGRVPDEMLAELAELGPGAAGIIATASSMSDQELQRFIELHGRSGKEAGDTFAKNLAEAGPVLRDIARVRGEEVADKVREGMDGGRNSVYEAARRIGIDIDNGIGKDRTVTVFVKSDFQDELSRAALRQAAGLANGGILTYADGGIRAFAGGGEHHVAQIASANTIRMWAEPETGGEAYIPLATSKRGRSEDILSEVADRFGGMYLRPMGSVPVPTGAAGGAAGPSVAYYNINVSGGMDTSAAIGARVVESIQEFERRSGNGWRK